MGSLEDDANQLDNDRAAKQAAEREARINFTNRIIQLVDELAPEFAEAALRKGLKQQSTREFFSSKKGWIVDAHDTGRDSHPLGSCRVPVLVKLDGSWQLLRWEYNKPGYSIERRPPHDALMTDLKSIWGFDDALLEIRKAFVDRLRAS